MIRVWVAVGVMCATLGCLSDGSTRCGELVCPVGRVCAPAGDSCVDPAAVAACEEKAEEAYCDFVDDGYCREGVCLQALCGNGIRDPGEACDELVDEMCAFSCQSDMTCGNGYIDAPVGEECDDEIGLARDGCEACELVTPTWRTGELAALRAPAIAHHTALGETILFGGGDLQTQQPTNRTLRWTDTGWVELVADASTAMPIPRSHAAIAYDSAREELVLFGGHGAGFGDLASTWVWRGLRWEQVASVGPSPRGGHCMTYDMARDQVVLFGGVEGRQYIDETWLWDGSEWTMVEPDPNPGHRAECAMTYDPLRQEVILFGGHGSQGGPDINHYDTWSWNGSGWTELKGSSPTLDVPSMTFDPRVGRPVMVGRNGSGAVEAYELVGDSWVTRAGPEQPYDIEKPTLGFDVARQTLLYSDNAGLSLAARLDTFVEGGSSWTASPQPTVALRPNSVAYSPNEGSMYAFEGIDLYRSRGGSWRRLETAPGPTPDGALAYETVSGGLLWVGDSDDSGIAKTWLWKDGTWSVVDTGASIPTRHRLALAQGPTPGSFLLFGGLNVTIPTTFGDTWLWDGVSQTWTELALDPAPTPRSDHVTAFDPSRGTTLLMGGVAADGTNLSDLWEFDGTSWHLIDDSADPGPRQGAIMVRDPNRQRILLHGGHTNAGNVLRDTWEWNGETAKWTQIGIESLSPERGDHSAAYHATLSELWSVAGRDVSWGFAGPAFFSFGDAIGQERCAFGGDFDGDGFAGCDDPDCWPFCSPFCPPGLECDLSLPRCGDGICNPLLENHRLCPESDDGEVECAAPSACGDMVCSGGESAATCAGDCPP